MKLLAIAGLMLFITGCNRNPAVPAKDVLEKFLKAMHESNFDEAKKYATADSQDFLNKLNSQDMGMGNIYNSQVFKITDVDVNGDKAKASVTILGNQTLVFRLKQEGNNWKVDFSFGAMMNMLDDGLKDKGIDIEKDVDHALDSIKEVDSIKEQADTSL